jgi:threonylcarbamoyladenosine tRNA methylthiotransferase MtaB
LERRGFHTITLGCKLNRFDTAAIEAELAGRGLGPQPDVERASVVIVNTCTVTGKADAEARRLVRSVRRRNRECRLLVTGCYAELDPAALQAIPGVDRVFGNRDKPRLPGILDEVGLTSEPTPAKRADDRGDRGCDAPLGLPGALHFGDRSRAFLRVQEGCDLRCSYCVIPRVRGDSRSVPPEAVEATLRSLLDSGYREVVLTGVNTGDYGKDLTPPTRLAALLRRLLAGLGKNRLRLNSLEPLTVTDEIVELMATDSRLLPHLQVPLQSGSATILRRMRRNYRLERYLERLEALRAAVPDVGLGADVIVGFPGETDAHFEETYRFVEASPLSYLHVFAWSPRPGTPASELDGRVHGSVVRERSRRLRELADRMGYRFRQRFEGRVLDAVVLGRERDGDGIRALTGNFIEVRLDPGAAPRAKRGDLVDVEILAAEADRTTARVAP